MNDPVHHLLQNVRSGNRMALFSQAVRLACKAASVVIIARLVPPAEHGLYALAATVTTLLFVLRDAGLGAVAVQTRTLSQPEMSALFRAQVLVGIGLGLAAVALGHAAAWFYREPALAMLVTVMSVAFPLLTLGGMPRVVLTRRMQLSAISGVETLAAVLATAGMIAAAGLDAGAYSFAIFWLISEGVTAAGLAIAARWRPDWTKPSPNLDEFWRQGWILTGNNFMQQMASGLDGIVMGRVFGTTAAGLYARAGQIMLLPQIHLAQPLAGVMTATLARCTGTPTLFEQQAAAALRLCAWLILPPVALVAALPAPWVHLLLGERWSGSAELLPWFAVGAAAAAVNTPLAGIALATGRTNRLLMVTMAGLPVLLAVLIAGSKFGPSGVVAALALFQVVTLVPRIAWVSHQSAVHAATYLRTVGPVLALAFLMGLVALTGRLANIWWVQLLLGGGLAVAVAGGALGLSATLRTSLGEAWVQLRRNSPKAEEGSGHHPAAEQP